LLAVENIAWAWGLARVELEVHESNLAAQLLYRRSGYRAVEILRGYYGSEDAYRMTKAVPPLTEGRPR
jgi:ribosomal protein S18 acetylase RimI-like enzyme